MPVRFARFVSGAPTLIVPPLLEVNVVAPPSVGEALMLIAELLLPAVNVAAPARVIGALRFNLPPVLALMAAVAPRLEAALKVIVLVPVAEIVGDAPAVRAAFTLIAPVPVVEMIGEAAVATAPARFTVPDDAVMVAMVALGAAAFRFKV